MCQRATTLWAFAAGTVQNHTVSVPTSTARRFIETPLPIGQNGGGTPALERVNVAGLTDSADDRTALASGGTPPAGILGVAIRLLRLLEPAGLRTKPVTPWRAAR